MSQEQNGVRDDDAQGRDEEMLSYIQQNRDRYTRDAIRTELMDRGFAEMDVNAALDAADAAQADTVDVRGLGLLIALTAFVLGAVVVSAAFAGQGTYLPRSVADGLPIALLYFSPGFLISAVVIVVVNRKRVPRAEALGAVLTGLIVPFVIWIGMTGFCLSFGR